MTPRLSAPRMMPLWDAVLDDDLPAFRTALADYLRDGYAESERTHDAIDAAAPGPARDAAIVAAVRHLMSLSALAGQLWLLEDRMLAAGQLGPCTITPDCQNPDGHLHACYTGAAV
jgi:hypothetical protein